MDEQIQEIIQLYLQLDDDGRRKTILLILLLILGDL